MAILEQLGADAAFNASSEQHTMRQNNRHGAFVAEEVETVQQEGKVRCGLRGQAVVFESEVFAQRPAALPPIAERRSSHHRTTLQLLGRIRLVEKIPVIGQGGAVMNVALVF